MEHTDDSLWAGDEVMEAYYAALSAVDGDTELSETEIQTHFRAAFALLLSHKEPKEIIAQLALLHSSEPSKLVDVSPKNDIRSADSLETHGQLSHEGERSVIEAL